MISCPRYFSERLWPRVTGGVVVFVAGLALAGWVARTAADAHGLSDASPLAVTVMAWVALAGAALAASLVLALARAWKAATVREAALRESLAELARQKFALDQHAIVAVTDEQGRIVEANDKFCAISQYARAELIGQNHRLINSGYHPKEFFAGMYRTITGGGVWRGEICNRAKDGSLYWVDTTIVPSLGADGKPASYIAIRADITERKRAVALALGQQQFALDEHAIVAVTDVRGTITHANDKFCAISGYTREELLGQNHRLVKSGRHSREFFREMYRTIGRGRVWRGEMCNRAKDGSLYWVDATIVPFLGANGKPVQYVAIRTDITERKKLEESLAIARDQALEASRLKSEFLAAMSHEVRTPMNAIIGMGSLLARTPLNAEQAEMTRMLVGGAECLLTIINDILDFSRIEAGKIRLGESDFNLQRVIEETVALQAANAQQKGLEIAVVFNPAPACLLRGDGGRVRQVATNLINNAIKFTERGEIVVTAGVVGETAGRVKVRVAVRDTGIGISPAQRVRLFQPFVQVEEGATRSYGGTGLGLAISRQLVEAMGGRIGVDSELGRGSTFWVELELPRRGPLEPRAPVAWRPGCRVLVVDDHATTREIILAQLTKIGAQPEAAAGGRPALARLRQAGGRPWDLVVIDCHPPGTAGLDLAREIRGDPALSGLPLVMLAPAGTGPESPDVAAVRFDGFLTKPVTEANLTRCVERVFARRTGSVAATPVAEPAKSAVAAALRVLLAEDNLANQRVGSLLLAELGHQVDIAANGQQALERLAANTYDVVLMDCQMPVLNGFDATRRIRSGELPGVDARIPIIAVTAYARQEDFARCREAGMNAHVSKPIRTAELQAALEGCGPGRAAGAGCAPAGGTAVLDSAAVEVARSLPGADGHSLLPELVGMYLSDDRERLERIAGLVAAHHGGELADDAHSLGGNAASFGGMEVRRAALALEAAARAEDWAAVGPRTEALRAACERLRAAIVKICPAPP